jgi:hypothetical protein
VDAIATPFVQGHLSNRPLSGTLRSECAHCGKPLEMQIDSDLNIEVLSEGAAPLISTPFVNLKRLKAPNIIDAF